jgi:phosphorylcholine metabolism protein LicD
MQKPSIDRSNN